MLWFIFHLDQESVASYYLFIKEDVASNYVFDFLAFLTDSLLEGLAAPGCEEALGLPQGEGSSGSIYSLWDHSLFNIFPPILGQGE